MIVMKFGGSSVASAASIKRVAAIVQTEAEKAAQGEQDEEPPSKPVVVVSAIGDTTDHLLQILKYGSRAESYLAWKLQEDLKNQHFGIAEDLLSPERLAPVDRYIRQTFRDLHIRILEVCEGERCVNAELRDWVASLGEKLSSRIVAAALEEIGLPVTHMDATKLILTDDHFTHATPRYWETYARIRWSVPFAARTHLVVMGGFIGATEDGRATTLGRGGSDLTASIVGAALNAQEIQVWKDVDGMLTWDPRIKSGGFRVKALTYDEAKHLAQGGATILHAETMEPAQRLRIPVIIRNTFRPTGEGTRIAHTAEPCSNPIKSIACKRNATIVEISWTKKMATDEHRYMRIIDHLRGQNDTASLLAMSDESIYVAVEAEVPDPAPKLTLDGCANVHVRTGQAIITLVGEHLNRRDVLARLARRPVVVLPQDGQSCSVRILVSEGALSAFIDLLQRTFFAEMDPAIFAPVEVPELVRDGVNSETKVRNPRRSPTRLIGFATDAVPSRPGASSSTA